MKMRFLLIIFFLTLTSSAFGASTCDLFSTTQVEQTIRELAELRLQLDLSQTSNDTSLALTALEYEFKQKENSLRQYLEQNKIMSYPELVKKIKEQISLIQSQQKDSTEEIEVRKIQKAELEKIDRPGYTGIFNLIYKDLYYIRLMNTKTTQIIWRKVANLINEKLGGAQTRSQWYRPWPWRKKIVLSPTIDVGDLLPMHSVSFDDVGLWIRGLNELSRNNTPELKEILGDHQHNDVYFLPRYNVYRTIMDTVDFGRYSVDDIAWTARNSDTQLHPVGQKQAVKFGPNPFYDLLSNITEWIDEGTIWGLNFRPDRDEIGTFPIDRKSKSHNIGFRIAKAVRKK